MGGSENKDQKTRLSVRTRKIEKGRLQNEVRGRGNGSGLKSGISASLIFWGKKRWVPEEFQQSPGPQVWGCGMQLWPWHRPCGSPEEFSNFTSSAHFSFHFLLAGIASARLTSRIFTFSGGWPNASWRLYMQNQKYCTRIFNHRYSYYKFNHRYSWIMIFFSACNKFLTLALKAISPKYLPLWISISSWSLPTG